MSATSGETMSPETNDSLAPAMLESRSPLDGSALGEVPLCDGDAVFATVARARRASFDWGELDHSTRRRHLTAWRREIAGRADELSELIHRENGKPRFDAQQEVFLALSLLTYAADRARRALAPRRRLAGLLVNYRARVSYHPLGVVGVIGPWNWPASTPMGSLAFALAAGNTVVFKPSELTPLVGLFLAETAAAAIPIADVLQVVTGAATTGDALVRAAIDKLAFTGSANTGRAVLKAAAERLTPVLLELGGKDPMIVTGAADIELAADAAVYGALSNAGQTCISVERVYVDAAIREPFVRAVLGRVDKLRAGAAKMADLGPITRPQQVDIIRSQIEDAVAKGARVLAGGSGTIAGNVIAPTVLVDVTPEMRLMHEETFGPVLPIIEVEGADEAMRLANASSFGLGAAVFAGDRKRGRKLAARIRSGMVSIDAVMAYAAIPALPFGGVGESGFGRTHGDEGLREFSRIQATAEKLFPLPLDSLTFAVGDKTRKRLGQIMRLVYGNGIVDRMVETFRRAIGR